MKNLELIRQSTAFNNRRLKAMTVLGKTFTIEPQSQRPRIIIHDDYPCLTGDDLLDFKRFVNNCDKIVMSGCAVRTHPYRLMYKHDDQLNYLVDIPDAIRGYRQKYPAIMRFVPALLFIPAHTGVERLQFPENFVMYAMTADKLLDNAFILDRMLILARKQCNDPPN